MSLQSSLPGLVQSGLLVGAQLWAESKTLQTPTQCRISTHLGSHCESVRSNEMGVLQSRHVGHNHLTQDVLQRSLLVSFLLSQFGESEGRGNM